jgi:WD40 repeat protein
MIEFLQIFLDHPLISLSGFILTVIGGLAAIDYFSQKNQEKKQARALAQKDNEKQYDVFLSYAQSDTESARKLLERLQQHGVTVWFEDGVAGEDRLQGIQASRHILAMFTPAYFHSQSTEHYMVAKTLSETQAYHLDKAHPLIPLLFETETEIPVIFQHYTPINFTNTANFEWAVQQLLETLNFEVRGRFVSKVEPELPDYRVHDLPHSRAETFVDVVAKIYRLQHFQVHTQQQWHGLFFDLIVEKRDLGMRYQAVLTCLDGYCERPQSHQIVTQYTQIAQALHNENRQWIVLAAEGFSQESHQYLSHSNIQALTFAELLHQFLPLRDYVDQFIEQYQTDIVERIWKGEDWFIPPDIRTDIEDESSPALAHVAHWMRRPDENLMTILGDLGTGKTTLAYYLAYQWARAFVDDPLQHPAPVLIPLRHVRKAISLENVISSHLNYYGLSNVPYAHFELMLRLGKVIVLFDGFDEMADRIDYNTMRENFRELARAAEYRSKIILTSRTQYFKDRQEQVKIIGEGPTFQEIETELYGDQREYGSRQQVVYLQMFDDEKIQAYLQRTRPNDWQADWEKIQRIYDMRGLAERPLLLEMIVNTLPQFDQSQTITVAKLYKHYTDQWVKREDRKMRLLDPNTRLEVMLRLSSQMWARQENTFTYQDLLPFIENLITDEVMDFNEEPAQVITREIQTASFLKRDKQNQFAFMHRSFMEYFLARQIHAGLVEADLSVLQTRRLDRKVVYFLTQLDDGEQLKALLENHLTQTYQPQISENALQIRYWAERISAGMEEKITDLATLQRRLQFPMRLQLQNAQLAEITLEAATLPQAQLTGAILTKANLNNSDFRDSDLQEADLTGAKCLKADFRDCNFNGAILQAIDFKDAFLPDTLRKSLHLEALPNQEALIAVVQQWHPWQVNSVAYSPDGKVFVTGCEDGVIRIWRTADYRFLDCLVGHTRSVLSVAFDPSGQLLASGSSDNTVRLWAPNNGRVLHTLKGHQDSVLSVAFDPSGQLLASGSRDKTVRLWAPNNGRVLHTLKGHEGGVSSVAFDPSGQLLASGSYDNTVRLWAPNNGRVLHTLEGHQGPVSSVAFDPSGQQLASGSSDNTVRLWAPNNGRVLHTLKGHEDWVRSVAFDPSGQQLASGSWDKTVRLWAPNNGQLLHTLKGHQGPVRSVAFDPSGQQLASGSWDNTVRLWASNNGQLLHSIKDHEGPVLSVAFDPSGQQLASGSDDKTVRLWAPNNGRLLHTLKGHEGRVWSVAFDPSGQLLASGSDDKTVRLWAPNNGRVLHTLKGHEGGVLSVAFDPSGQLFASGSWDKTVRLWETQTGECIAVLRNYLGRVETVAFAPPPLRYLVAAGSAGHLQFWDLDTYETFLYLYAFDKGGWLALLADGRFDGNPEGMRYLCYTERGTLNSYRAEELVKAFYDPEGVKAVLREYNGSGE